MFLSTENKKTIQLIISFLLLVKTIFYLNLIPRIRKFLNLIESLSLISSFVFSCCSYFIDDKFPIFLKGFLLISFFLMHGFISTLLIFLLGKETLLTFRKKIKPTFLSIFSMLQNRNKSKIIIKFNGKKRRSNMNIGRSKQINRKF